LLCRAKQRGNAVTWCYRLQAGALNE